MSLVPHSFPLKYYLFTFPKISGSLYIEWNKGVIHLGDIIWRTCPCLGQGEVIKKSLAQGLNSLSIWSRRQLEGLIRYYSCLPLETQETLYLLFQKSYLVISGSISCQNGCKTGMFLTFVLIMLEFWFLNTMTSQAVQIIVRYPIQLSMAVYSTKQR